MLRLSIIKRNINTKVLNNCIRLELLNNNKPDNYINYENARKNILSWKHNNLYTNKRTSNQSIEHVYPRSFYPEGSNKNIVNDMHLLFPCESLVNSYRQNYKFTSDLNNNMKKKKIKRGTYITSDDHNRLFYLSDISKGIVARSLSYSLIIYPELEDNIRNVIDINDIIKWSIKYPINPIENKRNNLISKVQGNENPFINNPNLAFIFTDLLDSNDLLNLFKKK
jgi:endonuclease I